MKPRASRLLKQGSVYNEPLEMSHSMLDYFIDHSKFDKLIW